MSAVPVVGGVYVPSTDDVRSAWEGWDDPRLFDAWLAAHDAEVRADERRKALGEAADALRRVAQDEAGPPTPRQWRYVVDFLVERESARAAEVDR